MSGNAKRKLKIAQWVLKVVIEPAKEIERPTFTCKNAATPYPLLDLPHRDDNRANTNAVKNLHSPDTENDGFMRLKQ